MDWLRRNAVFATLGMAILTHGGAALWWGAGLSSRQAAIEIRVEKVEARVGMIEADRMAKGQTVLSSIAGLDARMTMVAAQVQQIQDILLRKGNR